MSDLRSTSLGERIWRGETSPNGETPQQNAQVARRIVEEVWGQGNLNIVEELVAGDFSGQNNLFPGSPRGLEGHRQSVSAFRAAFSELSFAIDQLLAEEDRVALRLSTRGAHTGAFLGISPTNKRVSFGGMLFMRFRNGKAAEAQGIFDLPGLVGQLSAGGGN
jgi:predicted ester cyclase